MSKYSHIQIGCRTCVKKTMTTFIKAKLKKSDDQKDIEQYRVTAYITEYQIKINLQNS